MIDKELRLMLDRYLKNELDADEKSEFEMLLKENRELHDEYLFLKDAADALILLKRKELLEKFDKIEKEEQARIQIESKNVHMPASPAAESPSSTEFQHKEQSIWTRPRIVLLCALFAVALLLAYWYTGGFSKDDLSANSIEETSVQGIRKSEMLLSLKVPLKTVVSGNLKLAYKPADSLEVSIFKADNDRLTYIWKDQQLNIFSPELFPEISLIKHIVYSPIDTKTGYYMLAGGSLYELTKNEQPAPLIEVRDETLKRKLRK